MIFYTAVDAEGRTHWLGTQADARAINRDFAQDDFPTSKPELLARLNEMQAQIDALASGMDDVAAIGVEISTREDDRLDQLRQLIVDEGGYPRFNITRGRQFDALAFDLVGDEAKPAPAAPAPPTAAAAPATDDLLEMIRQSEGGTFAWYLVAVMERLGELRAQGWSHVQAINRLFRHGGALERGLGALILLDSQDTQSAT